MTASQVTPGKDGVEQSRPEHAGTNILVAYFSATGTTRDIAEKLALATGGDLHEIVPENPYTADDLDYNSDCRANREQNDDAARPAVSGNIDNIEDYDVIYLGYPIWWGKMPKILYTFLESYDFSEKTIIPFCTSGGSGIEVSVGEIRSLASDATVLDGSRFSSSSSQDIVQAWVDGLNLEQRKNMRISVKNDQYEIIYTLNDSTAARELTAQLPLTLEAEPFSNNEITFYPPQKLNTEGTPLSSGAAGSLSYYAPWGDVVMFYAPCDSNGSLYEIGSIVSGIENVSSLTGTVTISIVE